MRDRTPSGIRSLPPRSLLSVVALIAVLALATHLAFGAGGLLNRSHEPPGLAQSLSELSPHEPIVHAAASAACFRSAVAVTAVLVRGHDVDVRFAGHARFMTIQYRKSMRAALRYAYAHGSPDDVYANTNWFHTPAHLTRADINALSTCLPIPRSPSG